jgi:hypothetical protein
MLMVIASSAPCAHLAAKAGMNVPKHKLLLQLHFNKSANFGLIDSNMAADRSRRSFVEIYGICKIRVML